MDSIATRIRLIILSFLTIRLGAFLSDTQSGDSKLLAWGQILQQFDTVSQQPAVNQIFDEKTVTE